LTSAFVSSIGNAVDLERSPTSIIATSFPTSFFRSMSRSATVSMAGQLSSTNRMEAMQRDLT